MWITASIGLRLGVSNCSSKSIAVSDKEALRGVDLPDAYIAHTKYSAGSTSLFSTPIETTDSSKDGGRES